MCEGRIVVVELYAITLRATRWAGDDESEGNLFGGPGTGHYHPRCWVTRLHRRSGAWVFRGFRTGALTDSASRITGGHRFVGIHLCTTARFKFFFGFSKIFRFVDSARHCRVMAKLGEQTMSTSTRTDHARGGQCGTATAVHPHPRVYCRSCCAGRRGVFAAVRLWSTAG